MGRDSHVPPDDWVGNGRNRLWTAQRSLWTSQNHGDRASGVFRFLRIVRTGTNWRGIPSIPLHFWAGGWRNVRRGNNPRCRERSSPLQDGGTGLHASALRLRKYARIGPELENRTGPRELLGSLQRMAGAFVRERVSGNHGRAHAVDLERTGVLATGESAGRRGPGRQVRGLTWRPFPKPTLAKAPLCWGLPRSCWNGWPLGDRILFARTHQSRF